MSKDNTTMERKVQREMRFDLTEAEKDSMVTKANEHTKDRDKLTDDLKAHNKEQKARIKEHQKEVDRLLDNHVKGYEMREVEVQEVLDWEDKTVKFYFKDELIEEREMHDAELQMKLNTEQKKGVRKKKASKKAKKKTKAEKNPEENLTPEELKDREIAEVHQLETNRKSKKSAVDSARLPYKDDDDDED
jgi:hypothetical protein